MRGHSRFKGLYEDLYLNKQIQTKKYAHANGLLCIVNSHGLWTNQEPGVKTMWLQLHIKCIIWAFSRWPILGEHISLLSQSAWRY